MHSQSLRNDYNHAEIQFKNQFEEESFVKQKVQSIIDKQSANAAAQQPEQLSWSFGESTASVKSEVASEPHALRSSSQRGSSNSYSFNKKKVADIMNAYIRRAGRGEKESLNKL